MELLSDVDYHPSQHRSQPELQQKLLVRVATATYKAHYHCLHFALMHHHQSPMSLLVLIPGILTSIGVHIRLRSGSLSHLQQKTSNSGKVLQQQLFAGQILCDCCRQAPVRLSGHRAGGHPLPCTTSWNGSMSLHANRLRGDRASQ